MRNVSSGAEGWVPGRGVRSFVAARGRTCPPRLGSLDPAERAAGGREARAMATRLGALAASGLYRRRQHRQSPPPAAPG